MLPPAATLLERVSRSFPRSLTERLALTRRDLRMILDGLAGRIPPPVIRERVISRTTAPTLGARRARVREVLRETDDAVSVILEDVSGAPFHYTPGQFFTLCAKVNGESLRRAYSASRPPSPDGSLRITVKRVVDGAMSTWVTTKLRAGDTVDLLGPSGSFVVDDPDAAQRVVLIGGGSGVTPLYSIAATMLAQHPAAQVSMIYGSRSRADMIFAVEIEELAAAHPTRFSLHLALDQAHDGYDGLVGPLDDAQVPRALDALPVCELPRTYFLCGPTPMREAARRALTARGVEPAHIREEVYASPHRPKAQRGNAERVTLRILGEDREVSVQAGETILDAAMREGIDMPYSCAMGGCGACRCQRVAGEVVMETPNCLTEAERAEGAVLTCVGRPAGPGVVLEVP
jgi:ring-1,2-phenylacetyl-CoA epoxidase subunit PaaE